MFKEKHNRLISIIVFALLAVGLFLSLSVTPAAPDINVKTLDGKQISIKSLQGKPALVTFWATDCPGCLKEMPHLIALHNDYASKGLNIIGIAMQYDNPSHVRAMTLDRQLPYSIVYDSNSEAAKAFGDVRLTPTNFLIAPDGSIAMQIIGEFNDANMRLKIDQMLSNG
jgi:peroxiredoxin